MLGSFQELLQTKKFPSVITLFGEESFLVYEAYSLLLKKFQNEIPNAQVEIFDLEEIKGKEEFVEVLEKISFPSFFFEEKLFVLKFIEKIFGKKTKKDKLEDYEIIFKHILENPRENVHLIIITFEESLNGLTKKFQVDKSVVGSLKFPFDLLIKNHVWVEFPRMYESQLKNWLVKRVKEKGFTIDSDALDFFLENVNPNLWEINNELEKVITFLGTNKHINLQSLKIVLSGNNEINIFELTSLLSQRKLIEAVNFLDRVLSTSKQELLLLNIIYKFFRNLLVLTEVIKTTNDKNILAKSIGVSPYFINEYVLGLKNYSKSEIINALKEISNVDLLLKTSSLDSKFLFYSLLGMLNRSEKKAKFT